MHELELCYSDFIALMLCMVSSLFGLSNKSFYVCVELVYVWQIGPRKTFIVICMFSVIFDWKSF